MILSNQVRKRDGSIVNFDASKIFFAITRAGIASSEFNNNIADELTKKVLALLEPSQIQDIEHIQDTVEKVLWEAGFLRTARAYIVYREQHALLRADRKIPIDVVASIDEYLNRADWRVNANANQGYSLGGLILNSAGKMIANYWLSHVYPPEIGLAHREADIHIHDLDFLAGYCSGWSLRMLLQEGLNGVPGKVEAAPPKHMSSAIGQIVNFLGTLQNEWAGAQAFSSFDTYMAPYIRVDKLDYLQIKQNIQELIYNLNVPSRWGNQTVFSNLTFDWVCPEDLKAQVPIIGGKEVAFTYGDLQYEMDLINKAYIEVMTEGDDKGRIFTFPIPTYNITDEFPWNSENANLLFNMTAKYGLPYFQNFISSDLKPNMVRSMCLFPEERILFKEHEQINNTTIGNLFAEYVNRQLDSEWWECSPDVSALSLNTTTGKFEWAKITKFLRITDNRLVSIKTKDGKLMRVSANHLVAVFTRQGIETKPANEVTTDDLVLVIKNASSTLNQDTISKEDIKLAWFIGLFIADGNYLYDNRYELQRLRGVQISFNLQDVDLINTCRDFVKQRLNYEMKFIQDKRYKNSLYGYIYNKKFAEFLFIEKGVRKYGGIPSWLWNTNALIIKSFLSGFFDGDGCESRQEIHINDESLAKELNLLLQIVGISTTYIIKKRSQTIRIQHTLGRGSKGTKIKRDKLHDLIPQFLLNKYCVNDENGNHIYQCYDCQVVGLSTIDRWNLTNDKIEWLRHSDFAVVAVRSVHIDNLDYQQEFYDIELEKNHYFVHSDGNISHNCCRLQLDLRELLKRGNGLFGSAEQTGSIGVVTINCARLGYLFKNNIISLYQRLDYLLELAKNSLEIKRKVIQRHIDAGLFPYTKRYLGTLRNHFSTIGVNGINEMIRNFTNDNEDITTSNGHEIAARLLDHIRAKMIEFQETTGHMYNLEATPAEGTTYRFAKEDQKRYNEILQAGTRDAPYYTNSSQLPVGYTTDAFQALEMQEDLQIKYTGGTVLHLYMGERISNTEACKQLIKRALERFRVPYLTISPTFSICPVHGYIDGEHEFCPVCDEILLSKKNCQEANCAIKI